MSEAEYRVLDELYFMESYADLKAAVSMNDETLKEILQGLLGRLWVSQMVFDPVKKDYTRLDEQDVTILRKSFFVATREGLILHNSR